MATSKVIHVASLFQLLVPDFGAGTLIWRHRGCEWFPCSGAYSAERVAATWNTKYAGTAALESISSAGYKTGHICGVAYKQHRVIWAMHTGFWPSEQIDHIDHNRLNNRIENLRNATRADNMKNQKLRLTNKSGRVGVHMDSKSNKWVATMSVNGKPVRIGFFADFDAAVAARAKAEVSNGFHPNHGMVTP